MQAQGLPCKCITELFIDRVKCALSNLTSCAEVLEDSKLRYFVKVCSIFKVTIVRTVMTLNGASFIPRQMIMVANTPSLLHFACTVCMVL